MKNLAVTGDERSELVREASSLQSIQLSDASLRDVEMLAVGAFSPLEAFMGRDDYEGVLDGLRVADGRLFPMPVTLALADSAISAGARMALRNARNDLVAVMTVAERFEWSLAREATALYGTTDIRNPMVAALSGRPRTYVTGKLAVVNLPGHYDFVESRRSPDAVRSFWEALGVSQVLAFGTSEPLSSLEEDFLAQAASTPGTGLMIQAVTGTTKPGDVEYYNRIIGYRQFIERRCEPSRTLLNLLPLTQRLDGIRETLCQAIIQRNYGASCLIVPTRHKAREAPDELDDEQPRLKAFEAEIDVRILPITGVEQGQMVGDVGLSTAQRGVCIWFTGLSGAGKSTIAEILAILLMEHGRQTTLLDGDVVRTHLSRGLGFSRDDRDTNVRRIGFVASEIVRHRGIVLCAAVSPYRSTRSECRAMVGGDRFVEVFVDTPLEICEQRDVKGMYAKARRGEIKGFTGIDDPYEAPVGPEIRLTTADCTPHDNARQVLAYLSRLGFLTSAL